MRQDATFERIVDALPSSLASLAEVRKVTAGPYGVLVTTDVMLPNWARCVVVIEGGTNGERVTVSDGGAAFGSIVEAGFEPNAQMASAGRRAALKFGVSCEGGVLRSPPVDIPEVEHAIIIVANAMREVALSVWEAARKHGRKRFRERVQVQLTQLFADARVRLNVRVAGSSDDTLKFDYGITRQSRMLVVDAPIPDSSSIAAVVLRQADLKLACHPGINQAIVFDDAERWQSSSIQQLQLANVPVFSQRGLETGLKGLLS